MPVKGYHLSSTEWTYDNILNIKDFLNDFKMVLHEGLVSSSIKRLKYYVINEETNQIILNLGGCRLEIKEIWEAKETIQGLEDVLKNHFNKK